MTSDVYTEFKVQIVILVRCFMFEPQLYTSLTINLVDIMLYCKRKICTVRISLILKLTVDPNYSPTFKIFN